jgi:DNA-binding response OmpR family regulator
VEVSDSTISRALGCLGWSKKVAILSDNPLIGGVLEMFLESAGYEVRLLEEPEAFKIETLLESIDILLLGRGLM